MLELRPEVLTPIFSFPFTNTFLHTLIVDALILLGIIYLRKNLSYIPNRFQAAVEYVVDGFYSLTQSVAGINAKAIFPFFAGFFVFILVINITALFPGFGTIQIHTYKGWVPLLRSATSDFNLTFALAIISAIATHVLAIRKLGVGEYLKRYFSFNPIFLFVGMLEIVSEFTKVISLSFRLFGNILAGEAVLSTISHIFAFVLPLPFIALEIIVALVQALVFSILTMVFMAMLATPHEEHAKSEEKLIGGEIQ